MVFWVKEGFGVSDRKIEKPKMKGCCGHLYKFEGVSWLFYGGGEPWLEGQKLKSVINSASFHGIFVRVRLLSDFLNSESESKIPDPDPE